MVRGEDFHRPLARSYLRRTGKVVGQRLPVYLLTSHTLLHEEAIEMLAMTLILLNGSVATIASYEPHS
jgi:hypothetical protein